MIECFKSKIKNKFSYTENDYERYLYKYNIVNTVQMFNIYK